MSDDANLHAEERARDLVDAQLRAAGWEVASLDQMNPFASGVARREAVLKRGHGRVDYLLYVERSVVGVIEAKPVGHSLTGVEFQSTSYADGLTDAQLRRAELVDGRLPFIFEANGVETRFTNGFDPQPRSRRLFHFPKPETLALIVREAQENPQHPTWRAKVRAMPTLATAPLRPAQIEAIQGIEQSLADQHFDRSLVQMATGAGKTYTAVTLCHRLLTAGGFRRVLFLVDRNNLADQTMTEFENFRTPGEGRRFTELLPVQKLKGAHVLDSSSVVISTIQRVYSVLQGKDVPEDDDPQLDSFIPDSPVTVSYNPDLPPEVESLIVV